MDKKQNKTKMLYVKILLLRMTQQLTALATKLDNLSLSPQAHAQKLSSDPGRIRGHACVHAPISSMTWRGSEVCSQALCSHRQSHIYNTLLTLKRSHISLAPTPGRQVFCVSPWLSSWQPWSLLSQCLSIVDISRSEDDTLCGHCCFCYLVGLFRKALRRWSSLGTQALPQQQQWAKECEGKRYTSR